MEQAQRSPASTPQLSEDTRSRSNKQRRRTGLHVSLNNCDDVLCFLEDFGALVCKAHHTAVVNLDAHLLQHHGVPLQLENWSSSASVIIAQSTRPTWSSQTSPRR